MRVQSLSALVTGGASGLSLATATLLAERGARVVMLDLPGSPGEETAARIGPAAQFVAGDVTDPDAVGTALNQAETNGPLRAVVHCAGRGGDRLRIIDKQHNPGDYAHLAVSIIENPYLNGETIRLDGAIRMAPR